MEQCPERSPGDDILDRYVPHLSGADRELARERLQGLAKIMLSIAIRKVEEDMQGRDSRKCDSRGKIQPTA